MDNEGQGKDHTIGMNTETISIHGYGMIRSNHYNLKNGGITTTYCWGFFLNPIYSRGDKEVIELSVFSYTYH